MAFSSEEFSRAHALRLEGRLEEALAAFLVAASQGDPQAPAAAAVVAAELGRPRQALEILAQATARRPADPDPQAMMAGLHLDLNEFSTALSLCNRALALQPDHRDALLNRGMALRGLGDRAAVLANDRLTAQSYPADLQAQLNYADAALGADHYEEARQGAAAALGLGAETGVTARLLHGVALAMLDRFAEAEAEFAAAHAADPPACEAFRQRAAAISGVPVAELPLDAVCIFLSRWLDHQGRCDWPPRARLLEVLRRELDRPGAPAWEATSIAFHSLALPLTPAEQLAVARAVANPVRTRAPSRRRPLADRREGRLRVGYLSADFRQHPVAECIWRVFPLHDRDRYEIFAYALTPDDGSALRARIAGHAEHFVDLSSLTDEAAADRLAEDQLHILVDCSGYTEFARPQLLAARLATVQAQILGAPGPCGGDFVDYRITDAFATPPEVSCHWDEALAWLPDTLFLCDDTLAVPPSPGRAACGLPEDAFVFCCFNNHYKIEPEVFAVWMRLLKLLPRSLLWLAQGKGETEARLREEARQRGVAPERLVFAPRLPLEAHLARHACADLFLDTFHYNAGTTAVYALRAGLPVLTCAGATTVARMGGSVVRAAGLPELVTDSPRAYETLALKLAVYPGLLADLRQRLQAGADCPLWNMPGRVRALEKTYDVMWERASTGGRPVDFSLLG